jgi:chromosome segregation ATPase
MKIDQSAHLSIRTLLNSPADTEVNTALPSKVENEELSTDKNENKDKDDKVTISAEGLKKSKEKNNDENNLPENIQRINKQIKEIRAQIEQVKEKIQEIEDSELSAELKDKSKEQYQKQLGSLHGALSSAFTDLKTAIRDAKLDDASMLTAALIVS